MKQTKEEMEEKVRRGIQGMSPDEPDHLYSKMKLEYYDCDPEESSLTLRFPVQKWELNHMGTLHGGLYATAVDTTSGALVRNLTGCIITPTINLNINYLKPAVEGDALLVKATAERIGRHLANIHADCRSEKTGRLLASASINFMPVKE